MEAFVTIESKESARYALAHDEATTIGRTPENDIVFPDARSVSRLHAKLILNDDGLFIESFGRNGTLVNGAFLRNGIHYQLYESDVVQLGPQGPIVRVDVCRAREARRFYRGPFFLVGTVAVVLLAATIGLLLLDNQRRRRSNDFDSRLEATRNQLEQQEAKTEDIENKVEGLEQASDRIASRLNQQVRQLADEYSDRGYGTESLSGFPSHVLGSVYLVASADGSNTITKIGTSFCLLKNNSLVTNYHVVADASHIYIQRRGEYHPARLTSSNAELDIAILTVSFIASPLPFRLLSESDVGLETFAIGFPWADQTLGRPTVTKGIVSGIVGNGDRLITDAAINPGNSGGPLIDQEGRVVAMNTSVFRTDRVDGAALAVSVDAILDSY